MIEIELCVYVIFGIFLWQIIVLHPKHQMPGVGMLWSRLQGSYIQGTPPERREERIGVGREEAAAAAAAVKADKAESGRQSADRRKPHTEAKRR